VRRATSNVARQSSAPSGHGDLLIEGGPDSFIVQKPAAKELCEELGLATV